MHNRRRRGLFILIPTSLLGCDDRPAEAPPDDDPHPHVHAVAAAPAELVSPDAEPLDPLSVAGRDRPTVALALGDATLPVEARLLVVSADGREPELAAIRSVLDHRGARYDVFVATAEAPLTAVRLRSGDRGYYQGTILTSGSLAISGGSALAAAEWTALADYEQAFAVRRAVLAATPDPAYGFGSATTQNTSTTPLTVRCTAAGQAIFRDVDCAATQRIAGDSAYRATMTSSALAPILTDTSGNTVAAIHTGGDGRESILLLFRQQPDRVHSQVFLHGVLGWVTGGTYLGERRIDLSAQVDDLFLASSIYTGGTYRMTGADLDAALGWLGDRRADASTPDFRITLAFNGLRAVAGDALTEAARDTSTEWDWVSHTFRHTHLDAATYAVASEELTSNIDLAGDLPLTGFEVRSLVTPNVSGLVNGEAMRAAIDAGIRFAVTDTSKPGCDAPSPNTAFYNQLAPAMLLVPRRPTNLFYNVSTPAQWVAEYNAIHRSHWGRDSTYAQVLDQESDVLLRYLLRGEADPWMFHQANLRAYDGVHSLLGDLVDAAVGKLEARLRVPVRTQPMHDNGARFARRTNLEGAGVRATLFRGRALLVDAGRAVRIPVTGVRAGESYGGDVIGMFDVAPGTTTCVPLDAAGTGCSPAPTRVGGAGAVTSLPRGLCDGTGTGTVTPPPPAGVPVIARRATWRYRDRGVDLGTAWRAPAFDDGGWASGGGPLGYGESYLTTTVGYGPNAAAKYITTYFRRTFTVSDPAAVTGLRGELMFDDGAVVYLNGVEVGRAAMPAGTVTASSLSTGGEAGNAYTAYDWTASRGLLVAGTNTIAVEVHQANGSSSDLVFDLALSLETSGEPDPPPPPPPPATTGGVPRNATWAYWDNGGAPAASWRTQTTGATGWDTGAGVFGYGEAYIDTTVSYGASASAKHITTYFTTAFSVADPAAVATMIGAAIYDDGFVAYLNGVEIARAAMPAGTITPTTRSTGYETGDAYRTFDWTAQRGALRAGTNVLAVEVHQLDPSSSDLAFDLSLTLR